MKNSLYDILNVDKKATDEEIKKAYKDKARESHPDKPGGSNEKMQEIVHAYDVLKSKSKRDRYDRTGQENEDPFDVKFDMLIQEVIIGTIENNSTDKLEKTDLADLFIKFVQKRQKSANDTIRDLDTKIAKYNKIKNRFTSERISRVIANNITNMELNKAIVEDDIKFFGECLAVLNDVKYTYDPEPEPEVRSHGFYFSHDPASGFDVSDEFSRIFNNTFKTK
jgi:curved DNA-binding protein CbpA